MGGLESSELHVVQVPQPLACLAWDLLIGASLSEPHTSLRSACVCLLVRWWIPDLAITVNFKSANFTCTCTIIFKFNELHEPSSYLFDERW